jgi:hypothetical protein
MVLNLVSGDPMSLIGANSDDPMSLVGAKSWEGGRAFK